MMSGLDPTIVMVPPRMAQKPMGMTRCAMVRPVRFEMRATTGRNSAVAPTFCMNDDTSPTVDDNRATIRFSVLPP